MMMDFRLYRRTKGAVEARLRRRVYHTPRELVSRADLRRAYREADVDGRTPEGRALKWALLREQGWR